LALTARFTLTTMLKSAAFAFLLILSGCHKNAASVAKSHGSSLPDLATAEGAPLFATEQPYTEIVRTGDVWQVYDRGKSLGEQRLDDEGVGVFKQAYEQVRLRNGEGAIHLAAGGKAAFGEIGSAIRAVAKAGFWRIDFLVRSPAQSGIRALRLDLPVPDGTGPPAGIEPLLIRILADGSIYEGAGESRRKLEGAAGTSSLGTNLKSFAEMARREGKTPWVQVYPDRECSYQRVIDVMDGLHAQGISRVYFLSSHESDQEPDARPPSRGEGHLPVPPSRERLTEPHTSAAD
jgi:biopolymer transport protein ExbD